MRRSVLALVLAFSAGVVAGAAPARAGNDDPWTPLLERIPADPRIASWSS